MNPATLSSVSEGRRRHSGHFPEDRAEVGHVVDSHPRGDGTYRVIRLRQELLGQGYPDLKDVFGGGVSGYRLDLSVLFHGVL